MYMQEMQHTLLSCHVVSTTKNPLAHYLLHLFWTLIGKEQKNSFQYSRNVSGIQIKTEMKQLFLGKDPDFVCHNILIKQNLWTSGHFILFFPGPISNSDAVILAFRKFVHPLLFSFPNQRVLTQHDFWIGPVIGKFSDVNHEFNVTINGNYKFLLTFSN